MVLHCDGLYEIDVSALRVSPPPSPMEVAMREQKVRDGARISGFFSRAREALWAIPKKDTVLSVLEYAQANAEPEREFPAPAMAFLDLGCGNGRRVLYEASKGLGECVGVDFHPPIYNDCANASFFRAEAAEFLRVLKQRQIEVRRINADFFLGGLSDPDRTFVLEKIAAALMDNGEFSFCETVAVAKKVVSTLKMFPGISVQASGFLQSSRHMARSSAGRREVEKFLRTHPQYAQGPAGEMGGEGKSGAGKESDGEKERGGGKAPMDETGYSGKREGGRKTLGEAAGYAVEEQGPPAEGQAVAERAPSRTVPASMPILAVARKAGAFFQRRPAAEDTIASEPQATGAADDEAYAGGTV
jgi:SAM-dependent methyltransferase